MNEKKIIKILYKNYRGEVSSRLIIPQKIVFDKTVWHPEVQWLLEAYDFSRDGVRLFAMKDILKWENNEG